MWVYPVLSRLMHCGYTWKEKTVLCGYTWKGKTVPWGYTWKGKTVPCGYTWKGKTVHCGYTWKGKTVHCGYTWKGKTVLCGYTWKGKTVPFLSSDAHGRSHTSNPYCQFTPPFGGRKTHIFRRQWRPCSAMFQIRSFSPPILISMVKTLYRMARYK